MTKKIMSIFLCVSIITVQLFANSYNNSKLPQIPIYVNSNTIDLYFDGLSTFGAGSMCYVEPNFNSSMYSMEVEHLKTYPGMHPTIKNAGMALFVLLGIAGGLELFESQNSRKSHRTWENIGIVTASGLYSAVISGQMIYGMPGGKTITSKYQVTIKDKKDNKILTKKITYKDKPSFKTRFNKTILPNTGLTLFQTLSWVPLFGQMFSVFSLGSNTELDFDSKFLIKPLPVLGVKLGENKIYDMVNDVHPRYFDLYDDFIDLSIAKPDFSQINNIKENTLSTLGDPRGEFETSSGYSNRLELEAIVRESAEKEYQNNYNDISQSFKNDNEIKFNKIDEDLSKIFIRPLDSVALSKYDADEEIFIVTSQSNNYSKNYMFKVSIPIHDAPAFKENISNLAFQSVLNPTMDGNWNNIESQVKLIDTKTDVSIPLMPINDY